MPSSAADGNDRERESLELIYRNRVEFAVGHGVAVHAETADDVKLVTEVRTTADREPVGEVRCLWRVAQHGREGKPAELPSQAFPP
jgi:hypothetical protein